MSSYRAFNTRWIVGGSYGKRRIYHVDSYAEYGDLIKTRIVLPDGELDGADVGEFYNWTRSNWFAENPVQVSVSAVPDGDIYQGVSESLELELVQQFNSEMSTKADPPDLTVDTEHVDWVISDLSQTLEKLQKRAKEAYAEYGKFVHATEYLKKAIAEWDD